MFRNFSTVCLCNDEEDARDYRFPLAKCSFCTAKERKHIEVKDVRKIPEGPTEGAASFRQYFVEHKEPTDEEKTIILGHYEEINGEFVLIHPREKIDQTKYKIFILPK